MLKNSNCKRKAVLLTIGDVNLIRRKNTFLKQRSNRPHSSVITRETCERAVAYRFRKIPISVVPPSSSQLKNKRVEWHDWYRVYVKTFSSFMCTQNNLRVRQRSKGCAYKRTRVRDTPLNSLCKQTITIKLLCNAFCDIIHEVKYAWLRCLATNCEPFLLQQAAPCMQTNACGEEK